MTLPQATRRLTLACLAALGMLGVLGASASAAEVTVVTTGRGASITADGADLDGAIDTQGQETAWEFEYGTTPSYGYYTKPQVMPAGAGTVSVRSRLTDLHPSTTYYFVLVAETQGTAPSYGLDTTYGAGSSLTTPGFGALALGQAMFHVAPATPRLSIQFACDSTLRCSSSFTVITHAKPRHHRRPLTTECVGDLPDTFTIAPEKRRAVTLPISPGCLGLLEQARGHSISATLTARPTTGQAALLAPITLKFR